MIPKIGDTVFYHFDCRDENGESCRRFRPGIVIDKAPDEAHCDLHVFWHPSDAAEMPG
jgi:hypothetical protein